jgi:hypothetical protein
MLPFHGVHHEQQSPAIRQIRQGVKIHFFFRVHWHQQFRDAALRRHFVYRASPNTQGNIAGASPRTGEKFAGIGNVAD